MAQDLQIDDGAHVFESAVGEGWFLSGLYELLDVSFDVAGNDVSMKAIEECRMELPWGSFAVGDSLNPDLGLSSKFRRRALCLRRAGRKRERGRGYGKVGPRDVPPGEAECEVFVGERRRRAA